MKFKRFALGLAALALSFHAHAVDAQAANTGASPGISQKTAPCDWSYPTRCQKINADGSVNVSGSITASLGAFNPVASTSLAATTTTARVAFPSADTSVLIRNTGAADAYLVFGNGSVVATTGTGTLLPAGQAVAYAVGASTNVAAITASGSTSLAITTGTGLPALTGGGSGGGGGAVTVADGADVTQGAKADAAYAGSGSASLVAILKGLYAASTGPIPAGTAVIGSAYSYQGSSGAVLAPAADASAAINVSTATTTQLVALSSGKKIYVSALDVVAAGTGNITFVYGTGTNCGTGTTSLTGAYNLTAQAGIAKGNGLGAVLVVPASNALCVTTSAAVQMSGSVAYAQY